MKNVKRIAKGAFVICLARRELGFKTGTEAYGSCRLQLEQIRATKAAAAATEAASAQTGQDGEQGLSLLCKDAISRCDSGGTFVHC
jgi:hypothetical protein